MVQMVKICVRRAFLMKKVNKTSLNVIIVLALMVAISIICGKLLALRVGDILRFSFENMPIIFSGMAFGPIAGVAVGIIADLLGCVLVGYTINPIVTIGAAAIGAVAGIVPLLLKKYRLKPFIVVTLTVFASHFIGSVIIKTAGLAAFYAMPYLMLMLWRAINYIIVGAVESVALDTLLKSRGISMQLRKLKEKQNDVQ